jgi:hypothetical protein
VVESLVSGSGQSPFAIPGLSSAVAFEFASFSAFDTGLSASLTTQSAHPFSQAIGFVTIESASSGEGSTNPVTGSDMAALLDSAPTGSGGALPLQVRSVVVMGSGLHVRFNQAFDAHTASVGKPLEDALFVAKESKPVKGRIVVDPDGEGFAFIADGGLLPEGDYTVRLLSGAKGFAKADGDALDGDHDGTAGGDFRGRFIVTGAALHQSLVEPLDGPSGADADEQASEHAAGGITRPATMSPLAVPLELQGVVDSLYRWVDQPDGAPDSAWAAVTGGIGGVATLAAMPRHGGVPSGRQRRHRGSLLSRALDAGSRSAPPADGLEDSEPIRISEQVQTSGDVPVAKPQPWVSRWLGRRKADTNSWRIRP